MDWNHPEKSSQTLAVDSKGTLWVGTNTHIYYLLSGEKQFRQAGDKGGFGSAVSPDGRAWMYVPQKKPLVPLSVGISPGAGSHNISIPSDAFTFAHDGTLWTATQNDGLRSIPLESWHSAQDVGEIVDLGEVLAHEGNESDLVAEFDELDSPARNVHRFPPADVGVECASQVVLIDLSFVERPP
jgi:ligand-binding sensor domain-containing protein